MSSGVILARLASRHGHDVVYKTCMEIHGFPPDMVTSLPETLKIIKRIEK